MEECNNQESRQQEARGGTEESLSLEVTGGQKQEPCLACVVELGAVGPGNSFQNFFPRQ